MSEQDQARRQQAIACLRLARNQIAHLGDRTKKERDAADYVRRMIDTAESALTSTDAALALPPGVREGISTESRANWRGRGR